MPTNVEDWIYSQLPFDWTAGDNVQCEQWMIRQPEGFVLVTRFLQSGKTWMQVEPVLNAREGKALLKARNDSFWAHRCANWLQTEGLVVHEKG
jgi:hypothetical protein